MTRPAVIPAGLWPPRMAVEMAAGYCGERSAEAFLSRVGTEYPKPCVKAGRRQLWLKEDLDRAIRPGASETAADVAADL
ncbi:hypothetical protein [uncultured Bradyrhizobium sp.]|uniref:hypothetical protein n=1 Tax=uncultured Bradyrhizobium sp. TaxID=199684 RepID=UPI0035C9EC53